MAKQPLELTRKNPRQQRARQTVDTILEATARILAEEGADRLTTNHLARRAGFSIGTLYQYFRNRESVVLALIERQRAQTERLVALAAQGPGSAEQRLRAIVRTLHAAFCVHGKTDPRLTRALLQTALARGLPAPSDALAHAIVAVWRDAAGTADPPLGAAETFVLTRALVETLRHATLHDSSLLGTRELEDALLRLVLGFMRGAG